MKRRPIDDDLNAFQGADARTVRMLKECGDIGTRVQFDADGKPVLYLWQAFTFVRLDLEQMKALRRKIKEVLNEHRDHPRPPIADR